MEAGAASAAADELRSSPASPAVCGAAVAVAAGVAVAAAASATPEEDPSSRQALGSCFRCAAVRCAACAASAEDCHALWRAEPTHSQPTELPEKMDWLPPLPQPDAPYSCGASSQLQAPQARDQSPHVHRTLRGPRHHYLP